MSKILRIGWKDLLVILSDRAALLLILGGPLVLTLGMGLVTGAFSSDSTGISKINLIIVNEDTGPLGQALIDVLEGDDLADLLAPSLGEDPEAARSAASAGEVAAAVVIPTGFSEGLLPDAATGQAGEPVAVTVYGDPGRPISTSVVESIVSEFVGEVAMDIIATQLAVSQLARSGVPGNELPTLAQQLSAAVAAESSVGLSTVTLERQSIVGEEPTFNPLAYFAPAMALLFLMYTVTIGARSFLVERNTRTLARILATPIRTSQVIGGKVFGIFLAGFAQVGFLILLSSLLFGLRWGDPLGVVLVVAAAALAATGWGLLIGSLASTPAQVGAIGTTVMLAFGILGGSFVPLDQSNVLLSTLSKLTPNAWALDGFVALAEGDGLSAIGNVLLALLIMALVLFVLSATVFRRRQSTLLTG